MSDEPCEKCGREVLTVEVTHANDRPLPDGLRVAIGQKQLDEIMAGVASVTAENERLKRDAEIYEGLNKQRHEVIDELFLVKAERDRYRTVLQGIADDTDADAFELRQAARRALTNTTPPPGAEQGFEVDQPRVGPGGQELDVHGRCVKCGSQPRAAGDEPPTCLCPAAAPPVATPPPAADDTEPCPAHAGPNCGRCDGSGRRLKTEVMEAAADRLAECLAPAAAPPVALRLRDDKGAHEALVDLVVHGKINGGYSTPEDRNAILDAIERHLEASKPTPVALRPAREVAREVIAGGWVSRAGIASKKAALETQLARAIEADRTQRTCCAKAFAEGRDAALANAAMKAYDMGHPDVRKAINRLMPDDSPAIPIDDERYAGGQPRGEKP